jgi:hypothetical protein
VGEGGEQEGGEHCKGFKYLEPFRDKQPLPLLQVCGRGCGGGGGGGGDLGGGGQEGVGGIARGSHGLRHSGTSSRCRCRRCVRGGGVMPGLSVSCCSLSYCVLLVSSNKPGQAGCHWIDLKSCQTLLKGLTLLFMLPLLSFFWFSAMCHRVWPSRLPQRGTSRQLSWLRHSKQVGAAVIDLPAVLQLLQRCVTAAAGA